MFIGHFGVGFGAKAAGPRVSLGTLFLAALGLELTLLLLGVAPYLRTCVARHHVAARPGPASDQMPSRAEVQ